MPSAKTFPSIYTHSVLGRGGVINLRLHTVLICIVSINPWLIFTSFWANTPFASIWDDYNDYTISKYFWLYIRCHGTVLPMLALDSWIWTISWSSFLSSWYTTSNPHNTFLLAYSTSSESNLEEDRHKESRFSSVALFFTFFCCLTRKAMDDGLNFSSKLPLLLVGELTSWLSGAAMV